MLSKYSIMLGICIVITCYYYPDFTNLKSTKPNKPAIAFGYLFLDPHLCHCYLCYLYTKPLL